MSGGQRHERGFKNLQMSLTMEKPLPQWCCSIHFCEGFAAWRSLANTTIWMPIWCTHSLLVLKLCFGSFSPLARIIVNCNQHFVLFTKPLVSVSRSTAHIATRNLFKIAKKLRINRWLCHNIIWLACMHMPNFNLHVLFIYPSDHYIGGVRCRLNCRCCCRRLAATCCARSSGGPLLPKTA